MTIEFGNRLAVHHKANSDWLLIREPDNTLITALAVDTDLHRLALGLTFLDGRSILDVSVGPDAWASSTTDKAATAPAHLAAGIERLAHTNNWWTPLPDSTLNTVATAAAWPMLRPSIQAGHAYGAIPRWAAPLLIKPDFKTALRTMFGPKANRPIIRQLAQLMYGPVPWWALAIGIALPNLDPGRYGQLIDSIDTSYACTKEEFALLQRALSTESAERVARLLRTAPRTADQKRLLAALADWQNSRHSLPVLARSVDELVNQTAALLEPDLTNLTAEPHRSQQPQTAPLIATPAPATPASFHQPRVAPQVEAQTYISRFEHPPEWLALDRCRSGDVELVLPRHPSELARWGELLSSCLGSFIAPMAIQASLVLGIRLSGRLIGAVEIDPKRHQIVQMLGAHNRPLGRRVDRLVIQTITNAGALQRSP